jgi:hypothetical protein
MRKVSCIASVVVSALTLSLLEFASSARAGVQPAATLTVLKTVSGPVPTGATFTVKIECDHALIDTGTGSAISADVTFDATGQPTSADTVGFNDTGQCIINETATGGATTVTFSCTGSPGPAEPGAPQVCPEAGPQPTSISVNILTDDQTATVTVANTFVEPEPTPSPAVVIQPVFTG